VSPLKRKRQLTMYPSSHVSLVLPLLSRHLIRDPYTRMCSALLAGAPPPGWGGAGKTINFLLSLLQIFGRVTYTFDSPHSKQILFFGLQNWNQHSFNRSINVTINKKALFNKLRNQGDRLTLGERKMWLSRRSLAVSLDMTSLPKHVSNSWQAHVRKVRSASVESASRTDRRMWRKSRLL
jgi:hypothetical protein